MRAPDHDLPAGQRRHVTIPAEAAGERTDRALAAALDGLSRARIQALLAQGQVWSDGVTVVDAAKRVKGGQRFDIFLPDPEPAEPVAQTIPLDIVHEDSALLVLDKPAGLVVHPAPGNPDRTLVNALLAHCGAGLSGIGGVARPGIVHRLDKDTSGLMVVAKNDLAHAGLSAQFADRSLSRDYLALVRGVPQPRSGRIEGAIGRDPRNRKRMALVRAGGRHAATRYRVLRVFVAAGQPVASLVECALETGRTHQIRVHLTSIGHPLVGDPLYGGPVRGKGPEAALFKGFPRQALHATRLRFRHPVSGEPMQFERPLPADMKALIATLECFERTITE